MNEAGAMLGMNAHAMGIRASVSMLASFASRSPHSPESRARSSNGRSGTVALGNGRWMALPGRNISFSSSIIAELGSADPLTASTMAGRSSANSFNGVFSRESRRSRLPSSMEEQWTFNPLVQGSSPWGGTTRRGPLAVPFPGLCQQKSVATR